MQEKVKKRDGGFDFRVNSFVESYGIQAACNHYDLSKDEVSEIRLRIQKRREDIKILFTKDAFEKFRRNCLRYAASKNSNLDPLEFAGWATVAVLEGRSYDIGSWSVIRFLYGNYLKDLFGDLKSELYEMKRSFFFSDQIDEKIIHIVDLNSQENMERQTLFDIAKRLNLDVRERLCFLLHFRDGFSQSELGKYFGFSKGRAQELLDNVRNKILNDIEIKAELSNEINSNGA